MSSFCNDGSTSFEFVFSFTQPTQPTSSRRISKISKKESFKRQNIRENTRATEKQYVEENLIRVINEIKAAKSAKKTKAITYSVKKYNNRIMKHLNNFYSLINAFINAHTTKVKDERLLVTIRSVSSTIPEILDSLLRMSESFRIKTIKEGLPYSLVLLKSKATIELLENEEICSCCGLERCKKNYNLSEIVDDLIHMCKKNDYKSLIGTFLRLLKIRAQSLYENVKADSPFRNFRDIAKDGDGIYNGYCLAAYGLRIMNLYVSEFPSSSFEDYAQFAPGRIVDINYENNEYVYDTTEFNAWYYGHEEF